MEARFDLSLEAEEEVFEESAISISSLRLVSSNSESLREQPDDEGLISQDVPYEAGLESHLRLVAEPEEHQLEEPDLVWDVPLTDSVALLLSQAEKVPLLTAAEEVELAKRIEKGDEAAKRQMIEANIRLIVKPAQKFVGQGMDLADLIQEGTIGLTKAAEKFDWRKGYKFSTYATYWIKQSLGYALAYNGNTIRIPKDIGERLRTIYNMEYSLAAQLGRYPDIDEIAKESGIAKSDIEDALEVLSKEIHLTPLDGKLKVDGETSFHEIVGDETTLESGLEHTHARFMTKAIGEALTVLNSIERYIVDRRHPLDGQDPVPVRRLASELRISHNEVSRIEKRALVRLANTFELKDFSPTPHKNGKVKKIYQVDWDKVPEIDKTGQVEISEGEMRIMAALAQGKTMVQIARQIGIKETAAKSELNRLYDKLGLANGKGRNKATIGLFPIIDEYKKEITEPEQATV